MAVARYWRAVGLCAYGGGDVELSALQLYEGNGDPYYSQVALLLHLDGANGSTAFTDSSARPKTVTAVGGAAISTAQSKFGGASLAVSGGALISVADSADFNTETGDFTIELWVRAASSSANAILFNKQNGTASGYPFQAYLTAAGGLVFRSYNASTQEIFTVTTAGGLVAVGAWTHLAFVRFGNVFTVYVDGASAGSASYSGALPVNTWPMTIAAYSNGVSPYSGHVDDFRFTKGVARYTAPFNPPTSAFPNDATSGTAVRIDQSASLTSTIPPVVGSVASLQDGDPATTVRFAAHELGFALQWDFGVEKAVSSAAPGSASDSTRFLSHFDLQYSGDGKTWAQQEILGRYAWPGANALASPLATPLPLLVRTAIAQLDTVASAAVPAHNTRSAPRLQLARDIEFGGPGTIYGTTKTKGTPNLPTKARVVLQHQRSKLPVRETWSDPVTGAFVFTGIDTNQQFLALAEDAEGHFRPVAANRLTPEVA